jgi:hypothetical protein
LLQSRTESLTVAELVSKLRSGQIGRPPFAREGRWTDRQRSAFLETLWLGFPISPLFLVEDRSQLVVVDGWQRAKSIYDFLVGDFALTNLSPHHDYEGLRFRQLPLEIASRLHTTTLPLVIVTSAAPRELASVLFFRLNMTAASLTDAEYRKLTLGGPFYDFVRRCTDTEPFRTLVRVRRTHAEEEALELALRFFAFSERRESFNHDVGLFINDYISDMNQSLFDETRLELEFSSTMTYVSEHFPYGFRRTQGDDRIPRVRFEAIAVGVNLALQTGQVDPRPNLAWLESADFKNVVRTEGSNSKRRLAERIEFVRDRLVLTL